VDIVAVAGAAVDVAGLAGAAEAAARAEEAAGDRGSWFE
jgi:hypothetical protein